MADRLGLRAQLDVDADGWLSARQVLLVAFGEAEPVGLICFDLLPWQDCRGHVQWQDGKPVLHARLRSLGVEPLSDDPASGLRDQLLGAAQSCALELKCQSFEMSA